MSRLIPNGNNNENVVSPTYIKNGGTPSDILSGNWNVYQDWMSSISSKYSRR